MSEELKPGDRVRTTSQTFPVSTGIIELISDCGKYAKVRKKYGRKRSWVTPYKIETLKKCKEP